VDDHDVLGRDETGAYVAPRILLPLCQPDCHQGGIERLIAAEHLDGPMKATPGVLLGRIACSFSWLGFPGTGVVCVESDFFGGLAELVGPIGRDLRRKEGLL
jgi:hypothetical protein